MRFTAFLLTVVGANKLLDVLWNRPFSVTLSTSITSQPKMMWSTAEVITSTLTMDSGWQRFSFGNKSTEAVPVWVFDLAGDGYVWLTDAYCRGDSFYIYDNSTLIGETQYTIEDGCKTNTTSPDDAVQDGTYGHVYFNLTGGSHTMEIDVKDSPFLAGKAFIRLDSSFKTPGEKPPSITSSSSGSTIDSTSPYTSTDNGAGTTTSTSCTTCVVEDADSNMSSMSDLMNYELQEFEFQRCQISRNGLFLYKFKLDYYTASYFCRKFGMKLAELDRTTLVDALKIGYDCLGSNAHVWMRSYGGQSTGNTNHRLQLRTGLQSGKGQVIRVERMAEERFPFMCQRKTRPFLAH